MGNTSFSGVATGGVVAMDNADARLSANKPRRSIQVAILVAGGGWGKESFRQLLQQSSISLAEWKMGFRHGAMLPLIIYVRAASAPMARTLVYLDKFVQRSSPFVCLQQPNLLLVCFAPIDEMSDLRLHPPSSNN